MINTQKSIVCLYSSDEQSDTFFFFFFKKTGKRRKHFVALSDNFTKHSKAFNQKNWINVEFQTSSTREMQLDSAWNASSDPKVIFEGH